jgi:hypothetical protein
MKTRLRTIAVALTAALVAPGCGGDAPSAPPAPPATQAPAPAGQVPVACLGKWTSGVTGTVGCNPSGPNKDRVTLDKESIRLDRVCVNDPRVTSFSAGGKDVPFTPKPDQRVHCADLGGVQQLPESCSCVAPPGGDCTPPQDGFVCMFAGHVKP